MDKVDALTTRGPIIPFVDPDGLDAQSRAVLDRITAMGGFVPNSMLTYFHRPAIAGALIELMSAIFQDGQATLSPDLKGKIGIICSSINGCTYCVSHQCHAAQHPPAAAWAGLSDREVAALISGADEGTSEIEKVCFAYARAASFDPGSTVELLERTKAVLTSAQVVELASLVGLWKFLNTVHDSLHLPVEPEMARSARFAETASWRPS